MTDVERARIIVELDKLEKEKTEKESALERTQIDFASAWATYGSELAGNPDEGRLCEEITRLKYKIGCLKGYLESGKNLEEERNIINNNVVRLGEEISVRSTDRNNYWEELSKINYVLSVCKGEQ